MFASFENIQDFLGIYYSLEQIKMNLIQFLLSQIQ